MNSTPNNDEPSKYSQMFNLYNRVNGVLPDQIMIASGIFGGVIEGLKVYNNQTEIYDPLVLGLIVLTNIAFETTIHPRTRSLDAQITKCLEGEEKNRAKKEAILDNISKGFLKPTVGILTGLGAGYAFGSIMKNGLFGPF